MSVLYTFESMKSFLLIFAQNDVVRHTGLESDNLGSSPGFSFYYVWTLSPVMKLLASASTSCKSGILSTSIVRIILKIKSNNS